MITGQRVHIKHLIGSGYSRGPQRYDETDGTLVAFLFGVGMGDGFVEERSAIVVQTDDGRFVYCRPHEVTVRELAEVA